MYKIAANLSDIKEIPPSRRGEYIPQVIGNIPEGDQYHALKLVQSDDYYVNAKIIKE